MAGYLPPGWECVAASAYARVARNAGDGLYFKAFLPRSPLERGKALLRGSRAKRAMRNAAALGRAGFDVPPTLLHGSLSQGIEYLFMAAAPGRPVAEWLRMPGEECDLRRRRQLLRELGIFVGRLHASGFIHGDLRPDNVLADAGERFRFTLLDNERNRRQRPPAGRRLLRNLMQLNMLPPALLSRSDRLRFFHAWHSQMRDLDDAEAGLLASEAYAWAMRRQGIT
jgi:hypothetical protein